MIEMMVEMGLPPQDCEECLQGLLLHSHIEEQQARQFQPHLTPIIVNHGKIDTSGESLVYNVSPALYPGIQDSSALLCVLPSCICAA